MATLQQVRDKANAKLATLWPVLVSHQDAYFAKHGKYFQLMRTNEVVDGVDTEYSPTPAPDEQHLADVDTNWSDTIPFQLYVDEHVAPEGNGFSLTAIVTLLNGDKYLRRRNSYGEDTGWVVHHDWQFGM